MAATADDKSFAHFGTLRHFQVVLLLGIFEGVEDAAMERQQAEDGRRLLNKRDFQRSRFTGSIWFFTTRLMPSPIRDRSTSNAQQAEKRRRKLKGLKLREVRTSTSQDVHDISKRAILVSLEMIPLVGLSPLLCSAEGNKKPPYTINEFPSLSLGMKAVYGLAVAAMRLRAAVSGIRKAFARPCLDLEVAVKGW